MATALPGITFEPLRCGGYRVYARVPTFLRTTEYNTLIAPSGKAGSAQSWGGTRHIAPSRGRSQQAQGSDKGRRGGMKVSLTAFFLGAAYSSGSGFPASE